MITGASGFVGKTACTFFNDIGYEVNAHSRSFCKLPSNIKLLKSKSLDNIFSDNKNLKNIECVIHLAGKAQDHKKSDRKIYKSYFKNNTEDTLKFALECANASVKRFIYMSSIKVNGESNIQESFNENDTPNPKGPYALSKYESEIGLLKIAEKTNMEIVILRPPLIYGKEVKGYFRTILNLVKLKLPIPLGSFIDNKRSFIYLENLLNLLNVLIKHPKAANEIFLCSDDDYISTSDLLEKLSIGMHNKNIIFKFPRFIFLIFSFFGRRSLFNKLNQSLTIDNSKAANLLEWKAPISMDKALKKVAKEFIIKEKKL